MTKYAGKITFTIDMDSKETTWDATPETLDVRCRPGLPWDASISNHYANRPGMGRSAQGNPDRLTTNTEWNLIMRNALIHMGMNPEEFARQLNAAIDQTMQDGDTEIDEIRADFIIDEAWRDEDGKPIPLPREIEGEIPGLHIFPDSQLLRGDGSGSFDPAVMGIPSTFLSADVWGFWTTLQPTTSMKIELYAEIDDPEEERTQIGKGLVNWQDIRSLPETVIQDFSKRSESESSSLKLEELIRYEGLDLSPVVITELPEMNRDGALRVKTVNT